MEKSTYEDVRYEVDGPARVGSFDGGFGSAYQARVVGEKRAREIWFLLEQYSAEQAERWGLVNKVVPAGELMPAAKEARARLHHPGHVLDV